MKLPLRELRLQLAMMNVRLVCDDFGAGQTRIREMICALAVRSTEKVSH